MGFSLWNRIFIYVWKIYCLRCMWTEIPSFESSSVLYFTPSYTSSMQELIMQGMQQTLQWRHNGRDSVLNHQPHGCFLNRLFRHRSKKTSKLSVTCLCAGNSPEAGEFPAQMASNAENVSIWWRHNEWEKSWFRSTKNTCHAESNYI